MTAFSATIDRVYFGFNKLGLVQVAYQATPQDINEYIRIEDTGYLGQFTSGELTLELVFKNTQLDEFIVFTQDQDEKKTLHPIGSFGGYDERISFERRIRIYPERISNRGVTKYPTNHVKCVYVHKDKDRTIFQLWEIAIVSQLMPGASKANFFLTTQLTAESEAFRDELGNILLPDFEGYKYWESLRYYVRMLIDQSVLPNISSRLCDPVIETPRFEDNTGRVLWYNEAQQYGLVRFGECGQVARVHWSQIRSSIEYKKLSAGQMIKFAKVARPTQTTTRPTTIQWELEGVTLIR